MEENKNKFAGLGRLGKYECLVESVNKSRFYCYLKFKQGENFKCPWGLDGIVLDKCRNCIGLSSDLIDMKAKVLSEDELRGFIKGR